LTTILDQKEIKTEPAYIVKVCSLVKDRVSFVSEIWDHASFFFVAPIHYDEEAMKKRWKENTPAIMQDVKKILTGLPEFSEQNIHDALHRYSEEKGLGMGQIMIPLRIVLVGGTYGPELPTIAAMLGKDEVAERIERLWK
jgi:glutamyl-tRNA synthetase